MSNENNFLITYGLHNFVTYAPSGGKPAFIIKGMESQKMIRHAQSLIKGSFGDGTTIEVA